MTWSRSSTTRALACCVMALRYRFAWLSTASVGQPAAVLTNSGTEMVPFGCTTGSPVSCRPPKELQPSNPLNCGPLMVRVA